MPRHNFILWLSFLSLVLTTTLFPLVHAGITVGYVQDENSGYAESDSVAFFLVNITKGEIGKVDILNAYNDGEFTIANISQYDALLVGGDSAWFDNVTFSNALVQFIQQGGAIVVAFYAAAGQCNQGQVFSGEFLEKFTLFTQTECHRENVQAVRIQIPSLFLGLPLFM